MRVALFTDTYPEDVNGVANTLGKLVGHAAARGHEVVLVTTRVSSAGDPRAAAHEQLPGIPVPVYPELQLARGLDRQGRRLLERFRPDVCHVATESTVGFSGRSWTLRRRLPLVTSFHTNFAVYLPDYRLGPLEPLVWKYLRWFHRPAVMTLCPSQDTLEDLTGHGFHTRLRVWGRGVDTELFSPARRSEAVRGRIAPGADRILLYVGRLAKEKRVDLLLEAFEHVRRRTGPGTALVYVGGGPAAEGLRRRAGEGVHFAGFLSGVELAEAYAAADLFVFASDTETFGNVVLEAAASGLPLVVVDRGGVRETAIPNRSGVRAPAGDAEAFAEACLELLENHERRRALADGARDLALSRTWPAVLDEALAVWTEAVLTSETEPAVS